MTFNYNLDVEDDDFFADTFQNISEDDLLPPLNVLSKEIPSYQDPTPGDLKPESILQSSVTSSSLNISTCNIIDNKGTHSLSKNAKVLENAAVKLRTEDTLSSIYDPNQDLDVNNSPIINRRFIPGYTPKLRKRKFPGPAGGIFEPEELQLLLHDANQVGGKRPKDEIKIQNIVNFDFSADNLRLPSWRHLQADVFSCKTLLATAKYYSIKRVIHEASMKKLPKHIVVPVLCVLIKKINCKKLTSVFSDDTGEISGKIDNVVLDLYKEYIRDGTALILKEVTFLCNILLLRKQSMVSIYLDDGSVIHIQNLNSILSTEAPWKLMNCERPGTHKKKTDRNKTILKTCDSSSNMSSINNTAGSSLVFKTSFMTQMPLKISEERNPNLSRTIKSSSSKPSFGTQSISNVSHNVSTVSTPGASPRITYGDQGSSYTLPCISDSYCALKGRKNSTSCAIPKASYSVVPKSENIKSSTQFSPERDKFDADDLFCENSGIDDFDELLCSLDEKSFLEEI